MLDFLNETEIDKLEHDDKGIIYFSLFEIKFNLAIFVLTFIKRIYLV